MMHTIAPDILIAAETWERKTKPISSILKSQIFKSVSYYRKNRAPGGGCAIIFNETRFRAINCDIIVPDNIEVVWCIFAPKDGSVQNLPIKRIAVCSVYVSPKSQKKAELIEHLIESIQILRAKHNNEVNFLISGDFNRLDYGEILDSYSALKQIVSIPTRKAATLSIVLTDLHTLYHPPTTLAPLQVDSNKKGKDADHEIILLAPKNNTLYKQKRAKKVIKSRPILDSQLQKFEKDLAIYPWSEIFEGKNANEKASLFHNFLRTKLDQYFPEKTTTISNLDRQWMTPQLKQLHRKMQREFYQHRKSLKYKKLKAKFMKIKRKNIKTFYSDFVTDLKKSHPGKWYQLAKKIGTGEEWKRGEVKVESLAGISNADCAKLIAEHFAEISNQYKPIDHTQLPCFLPARPPPQVTEYEVYLRLRKIKKTKSTLPLDIPDKLRQECALFLADPLHRIINTSLAESTYPADWKLEWVTPAPKIANPKGMNDLRKISSTSDYSKVFEGFLKDWVMEDISHNIDISQYGGQPGIGTEHMLVCLVDRILKLLDSNPDRSAVILSSLDWSSAFDRQDPTLAIKKFVQLGVRPSLISLLASYLTNRKMKVKFNDELSEFLELIGGGPQGTLLGQLEYIVQSNDCGQSVPSEDRYKYIDDISLLHLVCLAGLLMDYNYHHHVPSDIGTADQFLHPSSFNTQTTLNNISDWSKENLMKINEEKCYYMTFSRSNSNCVTRLNMNDTNLDKRKSTKLLGIWISDDLSWSRNCKEITIKAFSRLSMLTKLKYVGVSVEDLLDIYKLHIRSITEYCSVVFHSRLTKEESDKLERIQRVCLKIILGHMYIVY